MPPLSVRDPMAKRVKALNERREQLKAGITASTSKRRAKLVQKNATTDRMRDFLSSLKVLQDSQVKDRTDQAGAGRHSVEGLCRRGHLRPPGAADRDRRDDGVPRLRHRDVCRLDAAQGLWPRRW
jgi:hypothetical protein